MPQSLNNIIVIHTDAQVYNFLSCLGHTQLKTPHLDQLAGQGMLFTEAYACSGVCVPSRVSLMTGRYPIAHGVTCNEQQIPATEMTMGKLFAAANYDTGYFGKAHCGGSDSALANDGWKSTFVGKAPYNQYLKDQGISARYPEKSDIRHPDVRFWNIGTSAIPAEHYYENVVTDRAIEFLKQQRQQPFLCFTSYVAPHGPFTPPSPYDTLYDPAKITLAPRDENELKDKPREFIRWVTQNQKYVNDDELRIFLAHVYGLISLVDDNVGRIIATLKETGTYENTTLIFASDHGDFASHYGIFGKSWCMDDCLMRIPLIISHPAFRDQRRSATLVQNIDLLPTMLDIAGIPHPVRMQGVSLMPILSGTQNDVHDAVFGFNDFANDDDVLRQAMIRRGDWKYVHSSTFHGQLYDLKNDPSEVHNLIDAPQHQALIRDLQQRLLDWHVTHSGLFYEPAEAGYWERRAHFYDESRFGGG